MIPTKIKESVKNTVGYAEADNKNSFIVGSQVAFSKCEDYYKLQIEQLERQAETYKKQYENVVTDLKTLSNIITKYSGL